MCEILYINIVHISNQVPLTRLSLCFFKHSSWIICNKTDLLPPYMPKIKVIYYVILYVKCFLVV